MKSGKEPIDTMVIFTPSKNEDAVDTKMIISAIQQYS